MEQILNYDNEAEQVALGSIILNNDYLLTYDIQEDYFYNVNHVKIFSHFAKSINSGIPINPANLKNFFTSLRLDDYLKELLMVAGSSLISSQCPQTLAELSTKRKLGVLGAELVKMSSDASKNSLEIKESIIERVEAMNIKDSDKKTVKLSDAIKSCFSREEINLLYTDYKPLDDIVAGFEDGDLVILAGRPAMGKSALAVNIATKVAKKHGVLIVSLEMNAEQVSRRVVANLATLHLTKLKYNKLSSQSEVQAFQTAVKEADDLPIYINDNGGLSLSKLRMQIKKYVVKGVKLVVIDYIQLLKASTRGNRVEQITEISGTLKALAMEFKVVIIGLSQLSRAVETRDDKRPQLSDLRESGSIEQDANCVIFAFRPEYYLEKEKPENPNDLVKWQNKMNDLKGVAYAIVAKNRDGVCGDARLTFEGQYSRFI